ncbi:MAG: protein kinase domain-containing protein [Thermoanaerobaculia bacterium]
MTDQHPRKIGKYDVLSVLGEGGMGVVYKARDPFIDRIVAIKTIKLDTGFAEDNLLARLQMEAKTAGRLQHPNIVVVYDFGQQESITYLVMEYVEGTNLSRIISAKTPIALTTRLDIAIQLCQGLGYAHEIGVIHRDIKPSNVCVTAKGVPKILDFGLARLDETRLTKTGFVSGTISYMSPERMRGESGPPDDIFAMGAVIYELFTYVAAFPGKSYRDVVSKIMSKDFPVAPSTHVSMPAELDAIILQALERDKKDRYASAFDFAKKLEAFRGSKALERVLSGQDLGKTTEESLEALMKAANDSADPYTDPEFEAATAQRPSGEMSEQVAKAISGSRPSGSVHDLPTNESPNGGGTALSEEDSKTAQFAKTDPEVAVRFSDQDAPTEMDLQAIRRTDALAPTEMNLAPVRPPERRPEETGELPPTVAAMDRPAFQPAVADDGPASFYPGEVSRTAVAVGGAAARRGARIDEPVQPEDEPELQGAEPTEAEEALTPRKHPLLANPFPPLVMALFATTLAAILAGKFAGSFAFLLVYAVAAVLWTLSMLTAKKLPLKTIFLLAAGFRLLGFVAEPVLSTEVFRYRWDGILSAAEQNPYLVAPDDPSVAGLRAASPEPIDNPTIPSNRPPWAQLLFVTWAWLGGNLVFWRLMLLAADMATIWMLWNSKTPRAALAWALFPLAVIEGFWNGHLEIVGAMLVLATCRLALGQHAIAAGAVLGFAGGTSLLPLAALSAVMDALNHRVRALLPMAAVLLAPYAIVGIGVALFDPLTRAVSASPTLRLIQSPLASWIDGQGWAVSLSTFWKSVSGRLGMNKYDGWVEVHLNAPALATIILVLLVMFILKMASVKSANAESAFASCIGVLLLISFAAQPSWWLLVVPVAILSSRPVWILFALFSPTLYLAGAKTGDVNWIVYGVSYIMPLLVWLGASLGKEKKRSAFDYRESYR